MEQNSFQNRIITITLLEIRPTLRELEKNNNEISIIFQGINVFYNLRKLLANNTQIQINNCKNSLIMSLVKSDNIFASALFNINFGENWVTFNYESKKKSSIKPDLNVASLIKIKILCQIKLNNNNIFDDSKNNINSKNKKIFDKYNSNSNNSRIKRYRTNINLLNKKKSFKNDDKNHLRYYSKLIDDNNYNNRYGGSIDLNKINHSIKYNKNTLETTKNIEFTKKTRNDINKNQFSGVKNCEYSLVTFTHSRLNTSISNNLKNKSNNNLHSWNKRKEKSNNIKNIPRMKTHINIKNYDILKSNSNYEKSKYLISHSPSQRLGGEYINSASKDELGNNLFLGYNKSNKSLNNSLNAAKNKQTLKNKLLYKNNNITNSYSTATTKKNEGSLNSFQEEEENYNAKFKNKKFNYSLTSKRLKTFRPYHIKNKKSKSQIFLDYGNNSKNNKNLNNFENNNNMNNNIFEDNKEKRKLNNIEEISISSRNDDVLDSEYFRLKNDFDSLYNEEYLKNVKNDLLKLEIELIIEKMIQLISVYHKETELKIIENKIIKNSYKENSSKYILLYKLNNKLKLIKDKIETKKYNICENKKNVKVQKNNNLMLNKEEFNIFGKIINSKNEEKNKNKQYLKEILSIALNNEKNKNIIQDYRFKIWLQTKQIKNNIKNNYNSCQNNKIIRTKIIPKKQLKKKTLKMNAIDLKVNLDNSSKIYNSLKTEGIYIKKSAKSPLYNSKHKIK